jgi:histidinol-phosphate aminotransferase
MNDHQPSPIRRAVREMPPKFDPPTEGLLRHSGKDTSKIHMMGLNECLFPPSPAVIEAIRANAHTVNRYPDAQCPALTDIITARTGIARDRIVWGNGSEELIQGALAFTIEHRETDLADGVVLPAPTFWGYRAMIAASGAHLLEVRNLDNGMPDARGIVARSRERAKLAFCITPNNPTGSMLSAADFESVAKGVPEDVLLFVDEAYYEFGQHAGGPDLLPILARRKGPWIAARTFSKAYAMAGMRIGYALCSDTEVANALKKTTCVFNVPVLAQVAGLAALQDTKHLKWILDSIAAGREQLITGMRALGLNPMSSVGNFVSVKIPMVGREAVAAMLARGVQINAWADPGFSDYIRITVGTAEMNAACLAALKTVLASA